MDYQYQAVEQPSNPRKTWPIVLSVVVALTVACGAGVYVYHNKRQEALDTCRQSLAEFSSARKAVLDTSENGSELQKLIRGALGVNDIIDAFADAATSAENTVDTEGCKADATITQLNLIAKTLDSATDSLNNSLKDIREKNGTNARRFAERFGWHDSERTILQYSVQYVIGAIARRSLRTVLPPSESLDESEEGTAAVARQGGQIGQQA